MRVDGAQADRAAEVAVVLRSQDALSVEKDRDVGTGYGDREPAGAAAVWTGAGRNIKGQIKNNRKRLTWRRGEAGWVS